MHNQACEVRALGLDLVTEHSPEAEALAFPQDIKSSMIGRADFESGRRSAFFEGAEV